MCAMMSSGIYCWSDASAARRAMTSLAENLRISSRIASSVSSRPRIAESRLGVLADRSRPGARAARRCCRRRSEPSTAGVTRAATSAATGRDRTSRTISPWLIGMPPRICARYSPMPMRTISSSISPNVPSACIRSA